MLDTAVITETRIDRPATLAFRIDGRVTQTEMKMLSDRVLEAFDAHDRIDLLLIFDRYAGSEPGASLSAPTLKAQTASLWNIRAYIVAGAPDAAEQTIETIGRVIPVKAKTFETEAAARDYLATLPPLD
jgi:hypothetical protein